MHKIFKKLIQTILLLCVFAILSGADFKAATLIVTKTDDTKDGACDADCSLREAIAVAAPEDEILFASPLFDTPQTITLSDAAGFQGFLITKSLSIIGNGAHLLTIRRDSASGASFRIFSVVNSSEIAGEVTVNLSGMTLSGGFGITPAGGGAIYSQQATINVSACHITGNSASLRGGGIFSTGNVASLSIINSTVSNNTSSGGTEGAGGIQSFGGTLAITNTTVSGNLRNATGSTNAGGIYASGVNLTLTGSTVTDNETTNIGTNNAGGVYGGGNLIIRNTLIAANRNNTTVPDIAGAPTSQGYNLIGNAGSVTGFSQPSDQTGTASAPINPRLKALSMNGGATPTHELLPGSPAVDKGNSFGSTADQRGSLRPIDNPAIPAAPGGDNSDIGSFEAARFASRVVTKTTDTNDGVCDEDCSLREAIAAATPAGEEITFASPLFDTPQTITLSDAAGFQELHINKNLLIVGKGAHLLTIRRDPASAVSFRIFSIVDPESVGASITVTLSGMTITGGRAANLGGAGIRNQNAILNVVGCHILENTSSLNGGGIFSLGLDNTLNLTNSTVSNNVTLGGGVEGAGGVQISGGVHTITNSTISGNIKSSLSNGADSAGGLFSVGNLTLTDSTITDNEVVNVGADNASGVYAGGNLIVRNTLIAANRNNTALPDVTGAFTSQGYNLVGNVGAASGFNQAGDQTGTASSVLNPRLAVLGNYGGTTPTHALFYNSPAINAADLADQISTDQRGVLRPLGGRSDIGAFELNFTFSNNPQGNGGQGTLPNAHAGQPYSVQFSVTELTASFSPDEQKNDQAEANLGNLYEFTIAGGSLPAGLTLNPDTGVLSGTPSQSGTFSFTVKVINTVTGMAGIQTYTLSVSAPTAASVTIGGKVLTPDGRGLRNALVTLNDQNGNSRTVLTAAFGSFRFTGIPAGATYIVSINSKRYAFQPQIIFVSEEITDLNFTAATNPGW